MCGLYIALFFITTDTVRCRYNVVNFLRNIHISPYIYSHLRFSSKFNPSTWKKISGISTAICTGEGVCFRRRTQRLKENFRRVAGNTYHDDVIKWKLFPRYSPGSFPRYWPFVRGIHRSPVNSPHKGQWRGALMLSLICIWINGWVNNREAGDFRSFRADYDVTVMQIHSTATKKSILIQIS